MGILAFSDYGKKLSGDSLCTVPTVLKRVLPLVDISLLLMAAAAAEAQQHQHDESTHQASACNRRFAHIQI